jgi:hypothetical protein
VTSFEVDKKTRGGWNALGRQSAESAEKAAGIMGFAYGPGVYRVAGKEFEVTYGRTSDPDQHVHGAVSAA